MKCECGIFRTMLKGISGILKGISFILKKFLIGSIIFYRRFISPIKGNNHCRYIPTCSQYALEAIEKYGPFKGAYLSIKRILRCNPFSKGGLDPVP